MHLHTEEFAKRPEECRDEFHAPVTCNVRRDPVFGENMNKEEPGKFLGIDVDVTGNKDHLLGSTINDD